MFEECFEAAEISSMKFIKHFALMYCEVDIRDENANANKHNENAHAKDEPKLNTSIT